MKKMTLLLLFGNFSNFLVFLGFWAILGLGYIGDWFWDFFWLKFRNLSKLTYLIVYPPNQKDLSSHWLRHQKNDTFATFFPFFALWVFFGFWSILGLDYTGYWFEIFFFAKISKFDKIYLLDCLLPLTKRIWVTNG